MSQYDHPSWRDPQPDYVQPDLWGNVPKDKPRRRREQPYDEWSRAQEQRDYKVPSNESIQRFTHELETVKTLLTAILNTLDEQKELMEDHTSMLEELTDLLLDDDD